MRCGHRQSLPQTFSSSPTKTPSPFSTEPHAPSLRPWQPLLFSVFLDLLAYLFKMEQLFPGKQRLPKLLQDPQPSGAGLEPLCLGRGRPLYAFINRPFTLVL